MLTEVTPVAEAALPIAALREHLRMGTGFDDDSLQDGLLVACLRAGLALVEARTGKAVLSRPFRVTLRGWRDRYAERLPVCPIVTLDQVRILDKDDEVELVSPEVYRLVQGLHRASLEAIGALPAVPTHGRVEIDLVAGYGAAWNAVPAGLRQAVIMVAAGLYEGRAVEGGDILTPTVNALLSDFRSSRLTLGRAG